MPPKGFKRGYVKHPETGEWTDPRVLEKERQAKEKKITVVKRPPKQKDDLGPTTKAVKDDKEFAKVIVSWKDARGRPRTTQYVMANLTINESLQEEFTGAKKNARIHLSLDGSVLEKT